MTAAETTMEARLAATTASLNHSLEWMKKISERSQSTEATLARISRMQASWAPVEMGARVATPTTPLSARPTMESLSVSPRREARMDELSRSIDASLAEIARLQEVLERRQNSIALAGVQVACAGESAVVGPIRADTELKRCLDMLSARRERTSVSAAPTTKSTARFSCLQTPMAHEDMCLDTAATLRSVNMGVVVDPPSDMSAAHQAFDEMAEVCKEESQSHTVLELSDEVPFEPEHTCVPDQLQLLWCEESCHCEETVPEESDDVLTHVGGSSLFLEFVMDTTDQVLDAKLLKDEQRSDAMFTQFAALHTQCHNQQCKVPSFLVGFGTWVGDTLHHGSERVIVCDAQKGGRANDIQMRAMDYSADNFYGKKKLKLANSFAKQWDPGIVNIISRSMSYAIGQIYGFNQSIPVQLIPKCSIMFPDKKLCGTILPIARLKCKLFQAFIHKSLCYMVFSAWDVCTIQNLHIKGLMPDAIMQFFTSISVQIVERASNCPKHDILIFSGVLMVALDDQLRTTDLWTAEVFAAFVLFHGDLINVSGEPLQMNTTRRLIQYGLPVQLQVLHYCFSSGLEIGITNDGRAARYLGKLHVVFHMLYRGQTFYSLICLANYLQYKQWDPGVPWVLPAALNIMITREMETTGRTWLGQGSWCNSWSYQLRPPDHAIAWGQAMFSGAGSVTPVLGHVLGQGVHGLWAHWTGVVELFWYTKGSTGSSNRHRTEY